MPSVQIVKRSEFAEECLTKINQLIGYKAVGQRYKGKLPNIEGKTYVLGDNRGVFHYKPENNSGYFTHPKTGEIVGEVCPHEEGSFAVYKRTNGNIVYDLYINGSRSGIDNMGVYQIVKDKDGNIVNLYEYSHGVSKTTTPNSNINDLIKP